MKSLLRKLFATNLICLLILLSSCSNHPKETASNEWNNQDTWLISGAASAQGYYYYRDDHFLSFFDFTSKKSVYLCDKAGCTHRDGDCRAYQLFATPSGLFYSGEKLYSFEAHADGLKLTRRDSDGSNYEEFLTLMKDRQHENTTFQLSDYRVCGDFLFYIGTIIQDSGNGEAEGTGYLYQVNLISGKENMLLDLGEKGGGLVAARKGQVLLQQNLDTSKTTEDLASGDYNSKEYLSSVQHKVLLWDEKTGNTTTLLEDNRWNLLGALAAYDNSYYIIRWDEKHETNLVERCSFDGLNKETVFKHNGQIANISLTGGNEALLFLRPELVWNSFQLSNFSRNHLTFLKKGDEILFTAKDGYIFRRILEYEGDLEASAHITKFAYSYLSFEDAKAGKENYVDFYIRDDTQA